MIEYLTGTLMLFGGIFCLVAALGIVRLPDLLTRMHAVTKAGTLGVGLLILAESILYGQWGVSLRAVGVLVLLFLTAPVAAHLVGRVSYRTGIAVSERTWIDELKNSRKGSGDFT